jgi:hypothetical protein
MNGGPSCQPVDGCTAWHTCMQALLGAVGVPVLPLTSAALDQCCPCPAGTPHHDEQNYCTRNGPSCYFYNETTGNWFSQQAACEKLGGHLVCYNTAEEQVGASGSLRLCGASQW